MLWRLEFCGDGTPNLADSLQGLFQCDGRSIDVPDSDPDIPSPKPFKVRTVGISAFAGQVSGREATLDWQVCVLRNTLLRAVADTFWTTVLFLDGRSPSRTRSHVLPVPIEAAVCIPSAVSTCAKPEYHELPRAVARGLAAEAEVHGRR